MWSNTRVSSRRDSRRAVAEGTCVNCNALITRPDQTHILVPQHTLTTLSTLPLPHRHPGQGCRYAQSGPRLRRVHARHEDRRRVSTPMEHLFESEISLVTNRRKIIPVQSTDLPPINPTGRDGSPSDAFRVGRPLGHRDQVIRRHLTSLRVLRLHRREPGELPPRPWPGGQVLAVPPHVAHRALLHHAPRPNRLARTQAGLLQVKGC